MTTLLLRNASAVLPDTKPYASILIEDGLISRITQRPVTAHETMDLGYLTLMPGFIDIHNHGAVGFDVNEAGRDELVEIGKFLASKGVTGWLPTFVPDSDENYREGIAAINEVMRLQGSEPAAQILGVHYEGVFANEKMCGALRPEYFKKFTGGEVGELPMLETGAHLTTFAPEIEGGIDLVKELKEKGWIPSIGHTRAEPEVLDEAFDAGASHLTHFYNAMTGLHHRDVGVVGWALTRWGVTFDIIADGIHVHPEMVRFACRSKTPGNVMLISDSVAPTGLGDGEFELWGEKVSVTEGKTRNERGSIAGSVITMLDAVKKMHELGFSYIEISKMASANPARLLGIDAAHGSIAAGKRADLVAIDDAGNVRLTLIGGKVAFSDL